MTLHGVFAPVPTPFDRQDRVDVARLSAAFARWLPRPINGFIVLGSNGEAAFLTEEESDRVVAAARDAVPRGRPLIVGTGRESTQAAIAAARRAAALGADAVLVRTPSFFKSQMTPDAFIRHYTAVAEASPVPVLLYNFTAATGVNMAPATAAVLAEHPNVIGMKESGSDIAQIADLVALTPPDFRVLGGSATIFFSALCAGAAGGILALAALLPDACARLFDLVRAGELDEARTLQRRLVPVARLISGRYGVPGLKAALALRGWDVGAPRPPLAPVKPAATAELQEALAAFEVVTA
ncbi:MAG TPA: dihydrodipicolinate synthase family protein [Vicinamibacterales bacterium]